MAELLATYSVAEILGAIIALGLAAKGVITFWDWAYARIKKVFDKQQEEEQEEQDIENKICKQDKQIEELRNSLADTNKQIERLLRRVDLLINSDKDSIKAYITREHHHFCYEQKWIDDYSLDCIEKRYAHYKEENGNSFIDGLMEELRELPKIPPSRKV